MLSVCAMHVVYKQGRIVGHELLHNDWCEADELPAVLDPLVQRMAELSQTVPGRR